MTTSTNSVANRFRMDGRVALIVGAGRGIGAASAIALAEAGCALVLASRTEPQVTEVAERAAELGVDAVPMASDATDPEACEALVDATVSRFGRLDVLVSVVGGSMPRSFMDTSDRMLGAAFERNVIDGLRLVRLAVPHLLRSDAASVVMVSSAIGHLTGRGYLAYGAAKSAVDHAVRLMANDLNPKIRVNAVAPGAILTEALEFVAEQPEIKDAIEAGTPLHRIGDPEDIAAAVLYLASAASSYMTGQILHIDGGLSTVNVPMPFPDLT